jgi:hypothetical protein
MLKWDVTLVSRLVLLVALAATVECGRLGYDAVPFTGDGPADADLTTTDVLLADVVLPVDAPSTPDAVAGCTSSGTLACPKGVTFADPVATLQVGGSGGQPFTEDCPAGQVLVGYAGAQTGQGYIGRIQATCGLVQISSATLAVTISAGATLLQHGNANGMPWTITCPADQAIVGFGGRSGAYVDQLAFRCAPLSISGQPGSYSITIGNVTALAPVGGTGGSPFPERLCAEGHVGVSHFGREGLDLDAFGILCQRPVLTY